jgi:hypothetical protein
MELDLKSVPCPLSIDVLVGMIGRFAVTKKRKLANGKLNGALV